MMDVREIQVQNPFTLFQNIRIFNVIEKIENENKIRVFFDTLNYEFH